MKRVPVQALIAVVACCILWIGLGSVIAPGARKHDFLNLYTGASLALDGNFAYMHDPQVQLARERRYVPGLDALVPFVRPPFYAALLAWLALIPFGPAFWIWIAMQSAMLLGCWIWAFRRWGPDALIFGALYLPAALGIAHGQDCVEMLVILLAAYTLAERKRELSCGAALGLGLIKFHLFLLWPLAMLLQRRWRMLGGYAAVATLEIASSWLLAGSAGVARYVALLRNPQIAHLNPSPELTISVHGLIENVGMPALLPPLAGAVLALFIVGAYQAPMWRWFAITSTAGLLAVPHVYGYDASLLLLGIWLTIFSSTNLPARLAATALSTPIPFMMTLAGKPWAALGPVVLLLFLIFLAAESRLKAIPDVSRKAA